MKKLHVFLFFCVFIGIGSFSYMSMHTKEGDEVSGTPAVEAEIHKSRAAADQVD